MEQEPQSDEGPQRADAALPAYPDDTLAAALARHGLAVDEAKIEQLDRYAKLLWDWNEKLNLTRHTDYDRFAGRDIADTLQLAAHLRQGEEVLDVGTGGGVPGLPLAILRPDLKIALCDSVGKKIRAVAQIAEELGLPVETYAVRAEELVDDGRFDALVIRAVGPLWKLLSLFRSHWKSFRRLLVIKGPKWPEELSEAKRRGLLHNLQVKTVAEYSMPGADGNSVILKIWPKNVPER